MEVRQRERDWGGVKVDNARGERCPQPQIMATPLPNGNIDSNHNFSVCNPKSHFRRRFISGSFIVPTRQKTG